MPTVAVVAARATSATRTISVPGELRAYQEVRLYPKVAGFVKDVAVDRGSRVRRGDVLARLEAPELTAQIAEAHARAEAADASLAEAEARYQASRATYARIRAASATDGAIAPDEMERARANTLADSAKLAALRGQAAAVHSAERSVEELGRYLTVTAPFDGIVTERNVHPGALVGPATGNAPLPMFRLQDEAVLRLTVSLPESYAGSAKPSEMATFLLRAFPSDTFRARLARKAGALDPQTRAEVLEFDVPNSNGRLKAGMYADVSIPISRPTSTISVPSGAIATSVNGPFVIAVIGDTTHWVRVRKGDAVTGGAGDRIEVFGDLRDGELVVGHATEELRSGVRVRAVSADTARQAGAPKPGRG